MKRGSCYPLAPGGSSINETAIPLKIRNTLPVNKYCQGSSEGIIKIKVDRW